MVQLQEAVAKQGMKRSQVNEIVLQLLDKYEERIPDAPKGKPFQECYDPRTSRPMPWYLDRYKMVKDELVTMGLDFPY